MKKRKLIKFNEYMENGFIIGLDIETETNGDETIMAYCCVKKIPFSLLFNNSIENNREIIDNFNHELFFNYIDLQNFFKSILNDGNYYLITIHNLSYEFSFFIQNVFNNDLKINVENSLFKKTLNKPLMICLGENIKILDSAKFSNSKLSACGDMFNFEKGEIDYKIIKYGKKPTKKEIEYVVRDVDITILTLVYYLKLDNLFILNKCEPPITSTAIIRHKGTEINGKKLNSNSVIKGLNKYLNKQIKNNSLSWLIHKSNYTGAYVHANSSTILNILIDVFSLDFTSSYPFVILSELYPKNAPIDKDDKFIKKLKSEIYNFYNSISTLDKLEKLKIDNWYDFLANFTCEMIIEISNLEIKKYLINNKFFEMPLISQSKCYTFNTKKIKCIADNGRIIKSFEPFNITVTTIDLIGFLLMYDFDFKILKCLHYETVGVIPRNIRLLVEELYKDKMLYKNFINEIELIQEKNDIIDVRKVINIDNILNKYENITSSEKNEIKNTSDFANVINRQYHFRKSNINGVYGVQVQNPLNSKCEYHNNNLIVRDEIPEEIDISKNGKTSYIYGTFITSYARFNLTLCTYYAYLKKLAVYYWDTDSLKLNGNEKDIENMIDWWNNLCDKKIKRLADEKYIKVLNGIGFLENEGKYKKFVTKQCKQYISIKNGKLKATISGLPNASKIYNDLLNYFNNDFEKMIYYCFNFNVIFDSSVTNKLYSTYTNDLSLKNKWGFHNGLLLKETSLELSNLKNNYEIDSLVTGDFNNSNINNIYYSVMNCKNNKKLFKVNETTFIKSVNNKIDVIIH